MKKDIKIKQLTALILIILIILIVFGQVIGFEFLEWDDNYHIYENPYMDSVTLSSILHFWKKPHNFAMVYTIWAIQAKFTRASETAEPILKFNSSVFHFTNLLFHILSALIVFVTLKILIRNNLASLCGSLLFGLHPVQVEPVTWITGLKDVLSGFFSLLAIWQYLIYSKKMTASNFSETRKARIHYIIATISFVLAMCSKPTTVIIPFIVLIIELLILKQKFRKIYLPMLFWIILTIPIIILTKLEQKQAIYDFVVYYAPYVSIWKRPLIMGDSLAFYLYKLFLPISLGPDYGRTPDIVLSKSSTYFIWIIPVTLILIAWIMRKRSKWLFTAILIFVVAILPVSGIIPFIFQNISTVADRYLYFAMLGPALGFAALVSFVQKKKQNILLLLFIILIILGIRSYFQKQRWKNTFALFKNAIAVNPKSWIAYNNVGVQLEKQGKTEDAIKYYNKVLQINPQHFKAYYNLGSIFERQGNIEKAIQYYTETLRINPNFIKAHINIAILFVKKGKIKEAEKHFAEALKINPESVEAHYNFGVLKFMQKRYSDAIEHFKEALRIKPDYADAHNNLGAVLELQGKTEEAIKHYYAALKINPHHQDARKNLSRILNKK